MTTEEQQWEAEKANIKKIVDECVARIGEHVDAVQVILTHHNSDVNHTMTYEKGSVNFHARLGAISEWMEVQRQYSKNWAIRLESEDEK